MAKDKEVNVLDELHKGACMGADAIYFIIDKIDDKKFKEVLKKQYDKYMDIKERICKLYPEYSNKKPHETSNLNKVMTWYGIEMNLMMNDSNSKIAELLIQGTNMGIIEGRKLLNHKGTNKDILKLLREYIDMQEDALEKLKTYL